MRQRDWSTLESLSRSRPSVAEAVASDEWIAMSEVQLGDLTFNFNHHQISPSIFKALVQALDDSPFNSLRRGMFEGQAINLTEQRVVGHTRIRKKTFVSNDPTQQALKRFSESIRKGERHGSSGRPFEHIVNIGIGGSDFGPRLLCDALQDDPAAQFSMHFVANIDGADLARTLAKCDPETTLFIIVSKTFTTLETLDNASRARTWLKSKLDPEANIDAHFAAVTVAVDKSSQFGIPEDATFGFSEDIGGRYSLWSSVGLAISLHLGYDRFERLLAGAERIDRHFADSPPERNIPVIMALLAFWYGTMLGAETAAIIPYSQRLSLLPSFLQQLEMESLGKSASREGEPLTYQTGTVIWGQPGTNAQHAFFQLLHQGRLLIPVDFIGFTEVETDLSEQQRLLNQNLVAQMSALAFGDHSSDQHRHYPGNRPSSALIFSRYDAASLGQLIALYEHKVFTLAALFNINAFDQWGVELGKRLARNLSQGRAEQPSIQRIMERLTPDQ
jgi:glucose-6-phosphate isomerase